MARKAASAAAPAAAKSAKRRAGKRTTTRRSRPAAAATPTAEAMAMPAMPDFREIGKMAKLMTPEQAIDLYKTNAKLALEVINTAIESTARLRKKQFEGEEEVRE